MDKVVTIKIGQVALEGRLVIPKEAQAMILFAHGSGSSRHSPRNNFVAEKLQSQGLATLLVDLLTEKEDQIYQTRFDIELLTHRLVAIVDWLKQNQATKNLSIGLFGSSTGAAAALEVAAQVPEDIYAVVSRGGRPDLASNSLPQVKCPVLLIVGGNDKPVIEMNQAALKALKSQKEMQIVPGATHLFEEPGTLEQVAELAAEWMLKNLLLK